MQQSQLSRLVPGGQEPIPQSLGVRKMGAAQDFDMKIGATAFEPCRNSVYATGGCTRSEPYPKPHSLLTYRIENHDILRALSALFPTIISRKADLWRPGRWLGNQGEVLQKKRALPRPGVREKSAILGWHWV